ncbi:hypothetical protein AJ78_08280 [Emergomyces pasteurianus Ep9510]|uniref:Zn(2)-C6 fungal-type domain-containing protein n=1 Tax=Emergomyces pasteurianus Ep9510 TaxID=1447872 RepID=A0A1J9P3U5_9EURO|nr:hypothetical protein AJ78_08280 [Emergomyces pasteurianus Ep9510]
MSYRSRSLPAANSNASITAERLTDRHKIPKATPRRSHFKTRTGCKTCKKRKCDEQRPSCRNCLKRGTDCDFLAESSVYPNYLKQDARASALNMLDLQLMHNFSTSTYATLSCHPSIRNFWKGPVVQMACRCDYVMRTVLAISALHLANYSHDRKEIYTSTALTYHRIAAREAMNLMSNIKKEDANNLFVFSVLTIFFALGGPEGSSGDTLFFEDSSFPEWLFLLRGTKSLLELMGPDLMQGTLSPLFAQAKRSRRWAKNIDGEAETPMTGPLDELEELVSTTVNDEKAHRIYEYAINESRNIAKSSLSGASQIDITHAFTWIYLVLDEFLPLLKVPTQESVAIFSFFCVFLKRLEVHWWMQGWSERLIRKAHKLLDEEHKLWINWPAEEIGCVFEN